MRKFASLGPEGSSKRAFVELQNDLPSIDLKETPGRITLVYTFPGFYFVDDDRTVDDKRVEFKQIEIATLGSFGESGKPMLPSFGRYIQIPYDADYRLTVKKEDSIVFENIVVSPAQRMRKDGLGKHVFEVDKSFYNQDVIYPEEMVRVNGPFNLDQYCVILLNVTPFQYNVASRKLIGYGKVTIILDLSQARLGRAEARVPLKRGNIKAAYGNLLLNPGSKIERRLGMREATRSREGLVDLRKGPEFLIIYYDGSPEDISFKEAAEKLERWKNRRGIVTLTVSSRSIGNDVPQIKEFIRGHKNKNPDLGYVLLFGDSDMIKAEMIENERSENIITDYYYATQEDPQGPKDYVLPWLAIGRIPVRTPAEGTMVVDQIISYEKNPPSDPKYYQKMTFAAEFEDMNDDGREDEKADYIKTMEEVRSALLPQGYEIERVYVTWQEGGDMLLYNNGKPVPADVRSAIVDNQTATKMLIEAASQGRIFIGHRDHGGFNGWERPKFGISELDEVTGEMPSIFYSVNCRTGKFDVNPVESFAEKNLRMAGGAPSLIAASRDSDTLLNNALIKGLFDATFAGVLPTYLGGTASLPLARTRLGDILNYAKSYLPLTTSEYQNLKEELEIYHVIGDPTLEVWTTLPRNLIIKTGLTNSILDVQMSECPQGSVLTVWIGEDMIKRLEPSAKHMTLSLETLLPLSSDQGGGDVQKTVYVCFWAQGFRYAEAEVN